LTLLEKKTSALEKALYYLIALFPLIIILRSATINVVTVIFLIFFLIYANIARIKIANIFKNNLFTYLFIFFLYILINSIFHNQDYNLILKSLGNFRYLLLTVAVYFVLEKMSKKQKKFIIYFNVILIILVGCDIVYQFFFYENIFGFPPEMCSQGFDRECQRFSGVFGDELIAGGYLSQIGMLFLILFYFFNQKEKNLILNKKIIFFLGLYFTIIITGERNAVLIITLTLLFVFFFKKN
jgi:hypothetical protein